MGITVRSVFMKSRSRQDSHVSSNGVEKRKWSSSVRSYLCGDEFSSVVAADDSASFRSSTMAEADLVSSFRATNSRTNGEVITSVYAEDTVSVRSSEATVDQPVRTDEHRKEKLNSTYKLFQQEDAALIIQSAFRRFLAKRARDGEKQECVASPSRESIGTSIEIQTGNSSDIFPTTEESFNARYHAPHKTRAQVLKIQEDWDDSTVSSVIAKTRLQNKLEAATRRERALAYAFSQQLRICSKKKQSSINGDETNTGWNWLERWMAARQSEFTSTEDGIACGHHRPLVRKRMLDVPMEEKESCGSNEVSSLIEVGSSSIPKNIPRPPKNRSMPIRSLSRQNSATSHLCPRESKHEVKKVCHTEDEREKRKRQKPPGNKIDVKNGTTHEVTIQHEIGK